MKLFITKVLSFIVAVMIVLLTGFIIGYKSINYSQYFKISDQTNFIFLGHSQPEYAYNDSLISGLSNFGDGAEAYFYTYLKTKKLISYNKQIKGVFIEFTNNQIEKRMDLNIWGDRYLQYFFPVYLPIMDYSDFSLIWKNNSKGIIDLPPKLYMENIKVNVNNFLKKRNIENENRFGGYDYLIRDKTDSLIKNQSIDTVYGKKPYEISETNILYLSKVIDFCKSNNLQVYLIRSPIHKKYLARRNEEEFRKILHSKFSKVEFLDFKDFPLQNHEFGDLAHLNYKGAKVFSLFFNGLLNSGILDKKNKQEYINDEIQRFQINRLKP